MHDLINFNGTLSEEKSFDSLAYNRGLTFGDGIFETMRVSDGCIPLWDYHWNRIVKSIEFLNFPTHELLQKEKLHEALLKQLTDTGNARVKLVLFRNGLGKYAPKLTKLNYLIITKPLTSSLPIWKEDGIKVEVCASSVLPANAQYGFLKKTSALPYILADQERETNQMDELIMCNTDGAVSEAIYHNVFIIKNNHYFTPPLSSGCVEGTMRQWLIDYLQVNNIPLEQKTLMPFDLMDADELFLTNAVQFITPVRYFGSKVKFKIKKSQQLFEDLIKTIATVNVE